MDTLTAGAALLLAGLLASAGALKLGRPGATAAAFGRIVPATWAQHRLWRPRAAAILAGAVEVAVAGLLVGALTGVVARVAAALAAALAVTAFAVAVAVAVRRGVSCGCWSSLSDGVAGGAELGRAAWLAVLGWVLLGWWWGGRPADDVGWAGVAAAMGLLAGMLVSARLGGLAWPGARASAPTRRRLLLAAGGVASHSAVTPRGRRLPPRARRDTLAKCRADSDVALVERFLAETGTVLHWDRAVVRRRPGIRPGTASTVVVVVPGDAGSRAVVVAPVGHLAAVFGVARGVRVFATGGALHVAGPATPW